MLEFRYAPSLRQPAHAHDYCSVSLIVAGSVFETAQRTEWRGRAGTLVVKPAGVVHEDRYGETGARMFTVVLPDFDGGPCYGWIGGGAPLALFARAIEAWRAGEDWAEAGTDLVAAASDQPRTRPGRGVMREVAERVELTDVSVEALARELSMHPVALARAFRRVYGCSLTCWRRRARVARALELLTATRMPLAEVALESGFSDQSHFCRILRSELGMTPAALRAHMS